MKCDPVEDSPRGGNAEPPSHTRDPVEVSPCGGKPNTGALVDMQCGACGYVFGWLDEHGQVPGCPRCGVMPDAEDFAHDRREIEDFRSFLRKIAERKAMKKAETEKGASDASAGPDQR
jgi:hypothetical protein